MLLVYVRLPYLKAPLLKSTLDVYVSEMVVIPKTG